MQQNEYPFFIHKLQQEFKKKKAFNRHYSLRQYANFLGLNSGTLSSILMRKRSIPVHKIEAIMKKLNVQKDERKKFLVSLNQLHDPEDTLEVSSGSIKALNESWEYFAILALFRQKNYYATRATIQKKTGIAAERLELFIDELVGKGYMEVLSDGRIHCRGKNIRFIREWASNESRQSQQSSLRLCLDKIEHVPFDKSKFSYVMVSLDKKRFELIKRRLRRVWSDIEKMNDPENNGHLYHVALCMFPLSMD